MSLINGGEYNIRISNGRLENSPVDSTIKYYNSALLSAYSLYFAAKFVVDIDDLAQIKSDLREIIKIRGEILYNSELDPSVEKYKESFDITLSKTIDILEAKLNIKPSFLSETKRLLSGLFSAISDIENFGEWLIVDAIIKAYTNHHENQYFNYESPLTLHGKLEYENLTDLKFDASSNETVNFTMKVNEKKIGYDIAKQGWGKTLEPKGESHPASQIPFRYTVIEGNATVSSDNPSITDSDGEFNLQITAGTKNSKIKLSPLIGNADIPDQIIDITVSETEDNNISLEKLLGKCISSPLSRGVYCDMGGELQNLLWNRNFCFYADGLVTMPQCMGPNPISCKDTGTWKLNNNSIEIQFSRDLVDTTGFKSNSITFKYTGEYNFELNKFEGIYYYHLKNHSPTQGYICEETKQADLYL